jgi:hypothetical protein
MMHTNWYGLLLAEDLHKTFSAQISCTRPMRLHLTILDAVTRSVVADYTWCRYGDYKLGTAVRHHHIRHYHTHHTHHHHQIKPRPEPSQNSKNCVMHHALLQSVATIYKKTNLSHSMSQIFIVKDMVSIAIIIDA